MSKLAVVKKKTIRSAKKATLVREHKVPAINADAMRLVREWQKTPSPDSAKEWREFDRELRENRMTIRKSPLT